MTACTQLWNFMYIDDAGRALADLAEYAGNLTDHGCVYNLGGPMDETGPLRGFVETVYAAGRAAWNLASARRMQRESSI